MGLWIRLQFAARLVIELCRALLRRARGRDDRSFWSLPQEATVAALRRNGHALMRETPQRARLRSDALALPAPRGVAVESVQLGALPARIFIPRGAQSGDVLLYVHGGAYVFGSVHGYQELLGRLAKAVGRAVVGFDYRLAPEAPFPAALEDTLSAYRALSERHRVVALGGDSAGGGLAVSALVALRDARAPVPLCAVLLSPWVDLSASAPSVQRNAAWDWGDRAYLQHWSSQYLGGVDPADPRASPVNADLHGLPPLSVHVGSRELLRDEVATFSERARAQGTSVDFHEWPDMVHGWTMVERVFPTAARTLSEIGMFVDRQLTGVT